MSLFKEGWHLIYTKPRQEQKVAKQLSELGIQPYVPVYQQRRQWCDRIKTVYAPIFPSYVFVFLNSVQEYFMGLHTDGACSFVKFGGQPARVRETEIQAIRNVEQNGDNIEVTDQTFAKGQQLVVHQGPLSGLNCEVVQHKGKYRILVRMGILQRNLLADLPISVFI